MLQDELGFSGFQRVWIKRREFFPLKTKTNKTSNQNKFTNIHMMHNTTKAQIAQRQSRQAELSKLYVKSISFHER